MLLIHSFNGHLCCIYLLDFVKNAMNTGVQISVQVSAFNPFGLVFLLDEFSIWFCSIMSGYPWEKCSKLILHWNACCETNGNKGYLPEQISPHCNLIFNINFHSSQEIIKLFSLSVKDYS